MTSLRMLCERTSGPRLRILIHLALAFAPLQVAFAEERTISFFHIHTKESATITFKRDGKYVPDGLARINQMLRDWRKNEVIKIDPALIDLIWEIHEELGSKQPVHIICGYRSSGTNEMLRQTVGGQARNSRHITGQAADLVFPDVPLKQLRYSGLIRQRGGVGFYPASGVPFVHLDTGNVRHWPRLPRTELAVLFPKGHSLHIPSDGRPLGSDDYRVALVRWQSGGQELPWAFTHKRAGPMLASLNPADMPKLQRASLTPPVSAAPLRPLNETGTRLPELPEPQLAEEGEEQEDEITFEPLPAAFLLAEKPLTYSDVPEVKAHSPVFQKIGLLMASPSALASEEFGHGLQIEELYETNTFKGAAFAFIQKQRAKLTAMAASNGVQLTR